MSDDLVKRLRDPAFGTETTERNLMSKAADRIEELEAKLAKAVEVAEKSIKWLRLYGADVHREAATLAELTGGKYE